MSLSCKTMQGSVSPQRIHKNKRYISVLCMNGFNFKICQNYYCTCFQINFRTGKRVSLCYKQQSHMKTVALKLLSSVSHCGTEELSGLV